MLVRDESDVTVRHDAAPSKYSVQPGITKRSTRTCTHPIRILAFVTTFLVLDICPSNSVMLTGSASSRTCAPSACKSGHMSRRSALSLIAQISEPVPIATLRSCCPSGSKCPDTKGIVVRALQQHVAAVQVMGCCRHCIGRVGWGNGTSQPSGECVSARRLLLLRRLVHADGALDDRLRARQLLAERRRRRLFATTVAGGPEVREGLRQGSCQR